MTLVAIVSLLRVCEEVRCYILMGEIARMFVSASTLVRRHGLEDYVDHRYHSHKVNSELSYTIDESTSQFSKGSLQFPPQQVKYLLPPILSLVSKRSKNLIRFHAAPQSEELTIVHKQETEYASDAEPQCETP